MTIMRGKWSVFLLLYQQILLTAAEWCNFDYDDDYETFCGSGCCDMECCHDLHYYTSPVPVIVGCSIGGFFFIVTIASVIYACFRSGTRPQRVISIGASTSVNTVTISSTGTSFAGYGPQPTLPQLPPYYMTQPPPYTPYPQTLGSQLQPSVVRYTTDPPPAYSVEPGVEPTVQPCNTCTVEPTP